MKRGTLILLLGFMAAAVGYGCVYVACTAPARTIQRSDKPELAWLRQEFKLNDAEFKRIFDLHTSYMPRCRDMCQKIDAENVRLQKLLLNATNASPEIDAALSELALMRAGCQRMMLGHFFQVSRTMPPQQGRRYLSWVKEKAFLPNYGMTEQP